MNEPSDDQEKTDPNVQPTHDLLRVRQLKKKEVQSKNCRDRKLGLCKGKSKARKPDVATKK